VHITREHALEHNVSMRIRVGINSGPVVAGVIGKSKYIYDLWGDTVNLASRMEAASMPDVIQVTRPVYEALKDEFNFDLHALKRIDYIGVTFRTRTPEEVRAIVRAARADLWPAVEAGKLSLPIDKTFPLAEAAAALAHMKANAHFGKIVLVV